MKYVMALAAVALMASACTVRTERTVVEKPVPAEPTVVYTPAPPPPATVYVPAR